AIDINKKTLQWAKKNGDLNAIENIKWKCGDLLNGVRGKFDLIITNPPQMPMISGPQHDWGGKNGRIFIDRIIHSAPAHLNPNGKLIMLLFDFLNVVSPYGDIETIVETCRNNNLIAKVISKKIRYINPDGKTIKSLPVIKNAYPRYKFKKKGDKLFHYVYVLSCAKRD
ncbi:MAG: methyltransferase, partial [Patescibacteria group bacterium]|nr:methyltransferase [Patescibacteria group bacterium]